LLDLPKLAHLHCVKIRQPRFRNHIRKLAEFSHIKNSFYETTKLIALAAVAVFIATTSKVQAQVDVTTNPISLLFGNINAGADFRIKENFSIEVNGAIAGAIIGGWWTAVKPCL